MHGSYGKTTRCDHEFWHSLGTDRSHVEHICWRYHPEVELLSQDVSLPEGMHVLYIHKYCSLVSIVGWESMHAEQQSHVDTT